MQVRTGRAAGHADRADARPGGEPLPGLDVDGAQMAVHADQAAAVIDEHRIAVEKKLARVDDRAGDGHYHRRAGRGRNVHAAVRIARLAVEYAAHAE